MRQNISLVTLGVKDLQTSRDFYAKLGWEEAPGSNDDVVFFDMNGVLVGLFGRENLAKDAHIDATGSGFSGISLAHNVASDAEVDSTLEEVQACGGTIVKPADKVFWGGYSGYFSDPDGHLWEVAHNPFWEIDEKGMIRIPSA